MIKQDIWKSKTTIFFWTEGGHWTGLKLGVCMLVRWIIIESGLQDTVYYYYMYAVLRHGAMWYGGLVHSPLYWCARDLPFCSCSPYPKRSFSYHYCSSSESFGQISLARVAGDREKCRETWRAQVLPCHCQAIFFSFFRVGGWRPSGRLLVQF